MSNRLHLDIGNLHSSILLCLPPGHLLPPQLWFPISLEVLTSLSSIDPAVSMMCGFQPSGHMYPFSPHT